LCRLFEHEVDVVGIGRATLGRVVVRDFGD